MIVLDSAGKMPSIAIMQVPTMTIIQMSTMTIIQVPTMTIIKVPTITITGANYDNYTDVSVNIRMKRGLSADAISTGKSSK